MLNNKWTTTRTFILRFHLIIAFLDKWDKAGISLLDHLDPCGGAVITMKPDLFHQLERPKKARFTSISFGKHQFIVRSQTEPAFEHRNACLSLLLKRKAFPCLPIMFAMIPSWKLCKVLFKFISMWQIGGQ